MSAMDATRPGTCRQRVGGQLVQATDRYLGTTRGQARA